MRKIERKWEEKSTRKRSSANTDGGVQRTFTTSDAKQTWKAKSYIFLTPETVRWRGN